MGLYLKAKDRKEKKIWHDGKECIWVDGFKATDRDMMCRNFQYELNKEYVCEGRISLCDRGFHFCANVDDTFSFYSFGDIQNRYFKVKALIYKEDWDNGHSSKYVAKKIIFTEELSYADLKEHIDDYYSMVKSEADWNEAKSIGYNAFCRKIFVDKMKATGFSEAFINVIADECEMDDIDDIITWVTALKAEKISKDMTVYFILKRFCYN